MSILPARALLLALAACVLALPPASASDEPFMTPLAAADLDPAAFAQWVDGAESPLARYKEGPGRVLWTRDARIGWDGVVFGEGKKLGRRHLRIGWKAPVAVGSVLMRGGGQVSVLKESAPYPGDLADESQWVPAQRLKGHAVGRDEGGRESYLLWVLPRVVATRALRISHEAQATDRTYAGWVGGAMVLGERFASLSAQATIVAASAPERAQLIANDSNDGTWQAWENGPKGRELPVTPEHPEVITLMWTRPVSLRGLCALWAGIGSAEVYAYAGPDDRHPREALAADWKRIGHYEGMECGYPLPFSPNWLDLRTTVTSRAVQLRITGVTVPRHPHVEGKTCDGRRVWLGELLALSPLGTADLATAVVPAPALAAAAHPPIPVRFTLKEAGMVTLVIDDQTGRRVRNLVAETPFPAGENTAWWDGMDDLGRDAEAASHGLYHIPGAFVQPGAYVVRGLTGKPLDLRFEFSVYNAGSPAWITEDGTGGWTTNHTPPNATLFVPADKAPGGKPLIYIGSYVSEGGHGLIWVTPDGVKQGGRATVGGTWTGAQHLARDRGPEADPAVYAYAGAGWEDGLRLTALTTGGGERALVKVPVEKKDHDLGGIAVHNGVMACTLPKLKRLVFVDVKGNRILGAAGLATAPVGVAFDDQGRLLVAAGTQLLRYRLPAALDGTVVLADPEVLATSLQDAQAIACDGTGAIYVSDHGTSHQVRVFSPAGKPLRAIGTAGAPRAGPYDPNHMNHPAGITIDGDGHLWVAESDLQPKRVSVWTLDGKLVKAFYGPSMYGGGGTLDPQDKTRFYFNGMEFRLDWKKGADQLATVLFRPQPDGQFPPDAYGCGGLPEMPHYVGGKRWFSNWHNSNPTNGASIVTIWREQGGATVPAAAVGVTGGGDHGWKPLRQEGMAARWPAGVDPDGDHWQNRAVFAWSDQNGDGRIQPAEVTMDKGGGAGGFTVMPDLAVVVSRIDGRTTRYAPILGADTLAYDLGKGEVLATDVAGPTSSGGDQAFLTPDGWTVMSLGPKPFAPQSLSGVCKGEARWSYPSPWPGLHASHEAPVPEFPGEVIGTTRMLGNTVTPRDSDAGPIWAINGNMGPMYLFTADGLFVATLFQDVRVGASWSMPVAERGVLLNGVSPHDENFWPSITQTADGKVYIVDGARTSLVRVDNLDTLKRLPPTTLTLTEADLAKAREFQTQQELARQQALGSGVLAVAIRPEPPVVDGSLADWTAADWATVDHRGTAAWFDSTTKPYDVRAAVCVAGDRLYAAWHSTEKDLLRNAGTMPTAPFKTGGCLDLMIGADARADPRRGAAVEGDLRLLVTRVKDRTWAVMYRPKVAGTAVPVQFSSPWRTITLDRVDDVSDQVVLAQSGGDYEISIPLATLGLKPAAGMAIKADLGVLRGDGMATTQRIYWSNKGTGITSDVPEEATLMPALWGTWRFSPP